MSLGYLVFIGAVLQFFGGAAYVYTTLQGKTKPNRVSWFLFATAPMIGVYAGIVDGVNWKVLLPVFMAGFMPALVFIASFVNPQAYWKLSRFDYTCGFFAVMAIVLWVITKNPLVAIIFAVTADALAALPTLIKAWKFPETENSIPFVTAFVAVAFSLCAIEEWRPSEYLFSIYLLAITAAITFAIYRPHIFKKRLQNK